MAGTLSILSFVSVLVCASALKCYTQIETTCTPPGQACTTMQNKMITTAMQPAACPADRERCYTLVANALSQDGQNISSYMSGCIPLLPRYSFGCFSRKDLPMIDSALDANLKQAETTLGVTYTTTEMCVCDGELCNGEVKAPQVAPGGGANSGTGGGTGTGGAGANGGNSGGITALADISVVLVSTFIGAIASYLNL